MAQHFGEFTHLADSLVESDLELPYHRMTFLVLRLCLLIGSRCTLTLLRRLLHCSKLLAGVVNVCNGAGDLSDLLVVGIFALNLILKVLL